MGMAEEIVESTFEKKSKADPEKKTWKEIPWDEGKELAQKYKVIIEDPESAKGAKYYTDEYTILSGGPVQFEPKLKSIETKTFVYRYLKPVGISKITLASYRIIE